MLDFIITRLVLCFCSLVVAVIFLLTAGSALFSPKMAQESLEWFDAKIRSLVKDEDIERGDS